jgi:hypothetical protein
MDLSESESREPSEEEEDDEDEGDDFSNSQSNQDNSHSAATLREDNEERDAVKQLSKRTTLAIRAWRIFILTLILGIGIGVTIGSWIVLGRQQDNDYRKQVSRNYERNAEGPTAFSTDTCSSEIEVASEAQSH